MDAALAAVALGVWLVAAGRARDAARHLAGAAAVFAAVNVPFLVWKAGAVLDAYAMQGERGITGESLFFVPLSATVTRA